MPKEEFIKLIEEGKMQISDQNDMLRNAFRLERKLISGQPQMKPRCYVAMPSGTELYDNVKIDFDEIYRTLIYPAATRAICQFDVVKLTECMSNSPITDTAIQLITSSPLMICDITTDNPNVIYELGIRHASVPGGTVIVRKQSSHPVPFYLTNIFIHFYRYPTSDSDLTDEITSLAGAINKIYSDRSPNQVYPKIAKPKE